MKKRDQDSQEPASTDPAAVIAQALRRKFAHNVFQDSPGTCIIIYIHVLHCFFIEILFNFRQGKFA